MDQVRIARFIDLQEAQIAAGLLQSQGLLVHLQNENLGAVDFLIRQAIGGFALWVPEYQAEEAKAALAAPEPLPPEAVEEAEIEASSSKSDGPAMTALGVFAGAIGVVGWPLGWPVAWLIRHRRLPATTSASGMLLSVVAMVGGVALLAVGLLILLILAQLLGGHQTY